MGIVESCDRNRNSPGVLRYKYETKSQNAQEESVYLMFIRSNQNVKFASRIDINTAAFLAIYRL